MSMMEENMSNIVACVLTKHFIDANGSYTQYLLLSWARGVVVVALQTTLDIFSC